MKNSAHPPRIACLQKNTGFFKPNALVSALAMLGMTATHAQDINKEVELNAVIVTAVPFANRSELDLAQPVSVLQGDDLRRKRESSLGDTLSQELGVTSSAFGPAAGRPIIRGMDGPRIRVLEGGIGTQDISAVSPDHMVTADPLNASQIEILRGPASLLYGSGASGGVVNVVTERIPNRLFKSPTGSAELRGNSATDERSGALNAMGSAGPMSWSVAGFKRKTGDYDTPVGVVGNSAIDSDSLSLGGAFIGERGYVGASVSQLDSLYGIPGTDGTKIDLKQRRYDIAGELDDPLQGFKRLKVRMGYNDYQHAEVEGSGEIGTRFKNQGFEGRAELLHTPIAEWEGVLGVQFQDRDFSAIGEEVLVPATKSQSTGLFLVEERNWARWRLEFGGRAERATQTPQDGDANPARAFNLYSTSAGVLWKFRDGYGLGLTATRGQRAPSTEELYSNGAHAATRTFQTGDNALGKETSNNIDLALRKTAGPVKWKVNVFHNRISDYIFERSIDADGDGQADQVDETGTLDPNGDYLVQNVAQASARFYGMEAEAIFTLLPDSLDLRLFTDAVRGKVDGGNAPRTPPQRFGLQLDHKTGPWATSLSVVHSARQDKLAELESETPGYTLANIEVSYRIKKGHALGYTLFVQGKNLLDEEIRVHTSYLKEVAPLPGRAVVLGLRGQF